MSDNVVRHRLLWSIFILQTEKWLDEMAASGLILCNTDFKGKFSFNKEEPRNLRYCFVYNKFQSKKTAKNGWEKVCHKNKWTLFKTSGTSHDTCPNRRGLYLRNNSRLCLYAFLSSAVLLIIMALTFLFLSSQKYNLTFDVFFRKTVAILGIFAIVIIANFIMYLTLTSANSHILDNFYDVKLPITAYKHFLSHETFEEWLEKLLIKDGDIFKRIHLIWAFTPDEIEKWLTKMQLKGYSFYKIHRSGTIFYFTKGKPNKTAYAVISGEGKNIASCIANGWQVVFTGSSFLTKSGSVAVISKTYEGHKPEPFLTDKETTMNAARILEKYTILYSLLLIILISLLSLFIYLRASVVLITILSILAVINIVLILRVFIYFLGTVVRAKKA